MLARVRFGASCSIDIWIFCAMLAPLPGAGDRGLAPPVVLLDRPAQYDVDLLLDAVASAIHGSGAGGGKDDELVSASLIG